MGCNGWNHALDCDCGWGGDTSSGTGETPVNLSSSTSINLVGTKMAEFKQTLNRSYSFNDCCDALLKMNMEIFSSSINKSDSFEIKTVSYGIGLTHCCITLKHDFSTLVITGESKNWFDAKNTVENFCKILGELTQVDLSMFYA